MKVLITGGASGLGAAVTAKFAANKSNTVYITYCHSEDKANRLKSDYPNVQSIRCDFANRTDVESLAAQLTEISPDVLINNAMGTKISRQYFQATSPEVFADGFQKNIMPVIILTQAALKIFRKRKSGKIITVLTSALLNKPPIGWSAYVAEKNYLLSMSKSWATENARFNITSNAVSPSFMLTDLNADIDERVVEDMRNQHPLKELLRPEEVADVIAFLAGTGSQVNGINFQINAAENVI